MPSQPSITEQAAELLAGASNGNVEYAADLRSLIDHADRQYYVESEPVMDDATYDALFKKLVNLETAHQELRTPGSPTQRVSQGLSERFPAVPHLVPMLSLDNTYNAEDLRDWDRKVRDRLPAGETPQYCVEPKYDGASISLIYTGSLLARGATRGDGIMGEEITANVRQIRSIPLAAALSEAGLETLELRGEVVIHKDTFTAYNEQRLKDNLPPLANPRNAASGTLRMLDPEEVKRRRLSAILYHISYTSSQGQPPEALLNHYSSLKWLSKLGFPTPVHEMRLFATIDEVIAHCNQQEASRDSLPYEIDGVVIKVNNIAQQEALGMTAHHPRWAVAYKFAARQATSVLRQVVFAVGRTGSVNPVAKIDPVHIGGVTVTSVSLFNEDVVREKDLHLGDTVIVERAGDVIPYIVGALPAARTGAVQPIVFPTLCPVCVQPLDKPADEAVLRCLNINCPAQVAERLIHFCSKDAMDIRGLGDSNVRRFYKQGIITDVPSLYHINWEQIQALGGFGQKSADNLRESLEASKKQPLNRIIFGLGIRHVGESTAKTLAGSVNQLQDLYERTVEQLATLEDIGPKVAASVVHFFSLPENREMIAALADAGLDLSNLHNVQKQQGGSLSGKTFVFTGTLTAFKRSEAEAKVEAAGGAILGGVSSKLNYLVTGTDAGSKLDKAKKLGTVTVLTEAEFLELIG